TPDRRTRVLFLRAATDGGTLQTKATYVYDAWGNRIEKQVWVSGGSTTTERFVLDGWKKPVDGFSNPYALKGLENFDVLLDLDGSNAPTMRRVFGDGIDQPVARMDAMFGNPYWYDSDVRGSVQNLLDN